MEVSQTREYKTQIDDKIRTYRYPVSRSEYQNEMANRILSELNQTGRCWLLDDALSRGTIGAWDWNAVLIAIYKKFGMPYKYAMADAGYYERWVVDVDAKEIIRKLYASRDAGSSRYDSAPRAAEPSAAAERSELQRLQEQKRTVETQLESLRSELREQNSQIARLRQEEISLEKRLHELREQTGGERQRILDAAQEQARQILVQARAEAADIRQSVLCEAMLETLPEPAPQSPGATRDEIEATAHQLENRLRDELTSYRDQMESLLMNFRTGLYATKYGAVCDAYQKLYLFATSMLEKRIANAQQNQPDDASREAVIAELRSIQGLLLKRIGRMERGLEAMGLVMIRPTPGSAYDCNEHAAENAEDNGTLTATVTQCTCPGVRDDTQVYCPAFVTVAEDAGYPHPQP